MAALPVTAIFDVGKTNKKVLLFDPAFQVVYEESTSLPETLDEDGFPCEDIGLLTQWLRDRHDALRADHRFDIRRINFSGYGASFVLLNSGGQVIAPLYNYLKPYPQELQEMFYDRYGGKQRLCRETASPALGSLNSGLQLYRLKYERPDVFNRTEQALHLPNYLGYVLSGQVASEITSVGCHTHLWDFNRQDYHEWAEREGILEKLAPLQRFGAPATQRTRGAWIGTGLHDSSAALIPYIKRVKEPFVLISTGTWSICLNPFNEFPLTDEELQADCLCYLTPEGRQVKASRLHLGPMHEKICHALSAVFDRPADHWIGTPFNPAHSQMHHPGQVELAEDPEKAYHHAMQPLVDLQIAKLELVLGDRKGKQVFVDGGFARNAVFMGLLSARLKEYAVQASTLAQASALGAAMHMA